MEEAPLYGGLTVYRERGAFLRRLEQLEKAKDAYDEAHSIAPEDVGTLMGRSRVCADAVKPAQAFADAEKAFALEPTNMTAKFMQAQAMYEMSEFERSLINHYRGLRIRKQPPYFTNGINLCLETIEDCVGAGAGDMLTCMSALIKRQEEAIAAAALAPPKPKRVSRIPAPVEKKKMTEGEIKTHLCLSRVLAMKYLGPMAYDKFFLQELLHHKGVDSANREGSKRLRKLVQEAYKSLVERQEMLRTRRPYYTVKLAEAKDTERTIREREETLRNKREVCSKMCDKMIRRCVNELMVGNTRGLMQAGMRFQNYLDTLSPKALPEKNAYKERLYRTVGEGYLRQYQINYNMTERAGRRRVAYLMGMPVSKNGDYDPIIAVYPHKFRDREAEAADMVERLEIEENVQARCFLFYELAKSSLEIKNYALSKFYAKSNEVRLTVDEAMEFVSKLSGTELLVNFLDKCLEVATIGGSGDEGKAILAREQEVLGVMEENQKIEMQQLFKVMWRVPGGRRFSVLPRKSDAAYSAPVRKKYMQRGLTVVPGPEAALIPPPKGHVLGFQIFDL